MEVVGQYTHCFDLEWHRGIGLAPRISKASHAQLGVQNGLALVCDNREEKHATLEPYPAIP